MQDETEGSLPRAAGQDLFSLHRQQLVIQALLRLAFFEGSLEALLGRVLREIVSVRWLPLASKGGIFLVDDEDHRWLRLAAQLNFAPEHAAACAGVRLGACLCGRCAKQRKVVFRSSVTPEHRKGHSGKVNHGHYVLPLMAGKRLLGVLNLYTAAGHRPAGDEEEFLILICRTLAALIEKKQAEERLRKSEASLRKSQRIAHLGHWEWDFAADRVSLSPEVHCLFGLDRGSSRRRLDYRFFLGLVHPEDRFGVHRAVVEALNERRGFQFEHRVQLSDGAIKFVRQEGEPIRGGEGEPVGMLVVVQDLTDLKRSETQLHLAARIFEHSIEGIAITDTLGVIERVNPAFSSITGYAAGEAVGKCLKVIKSDRQDPEFHRRLWESLRREGFWQGEIWNRRKNGEIYPEWLTVSSVRTPLGRVGHYLAIFHDMTEVRQAEEQLRYKSNHDALTGLPNRIKLLERLQVILTRLRRYHAKVAVLAVDIDNFKRINESLGHPAGDLLLQQFVQRCRALLTEETMIARVGGDDFFIILDDLENEDEVGAMAEKIIADLSEPFRLDSHELFVTVSIGITFAPADGDTPEHLVRNAETAMYRAKEEGKNRYRLFTQAMNTRIVKRLQLENHLRRALEREEFLVYYQPKLELTQGRIVGMEALVRWKRPGAGLVSPADFIPLAEENGLIIPIGEWVLAAACRQAQLWRAAGHDLALAVNLSPRQFAQRDLPGRIDFILAETGFPAPLLQLEITEGAVLDNEAAALEILRDLRTRGIKIALDDFGTGYSSLHYLRQLPIDTLKIDRSFISDLPADRDGAAITSAILAMAESLNLEVVAEGVETEENLGFLCQKGCKYAQGYLISRPLPDREFARLLEGGTELGQARCHQRSSSFPCFRHVQDATPSTT